jgi:transposase
MIGGDPMGTKLYHALTDREWQAIERVLPKQRTGRPRKNDREHIGELLWSLALNNSPYDPKELNHYALLNMKRRRWQADGTWPRILEAGEPAIARMRRRQGYSNEPMWKLARRWRSAAFP